MARITMPTEKDAAGVVPGSKETADDIFKGRAADDTGVEDDDKVPFNEHPRWKQVYGENKEYKELGTPAELKEKLSQVSKVDEYEGYIAHLTEKIEKLEAKKDDDDPKTDKQRQFESLRKQARAELAKIAPEIDQIAAGQRASNEWDTYYAALERQAYKETASVLKAAGLESGTKDVNETAAILADLIGSDRDLYLEYRTNPREAVREAWGRLTKRYNVERGVKADIERDKKALEKLPKPHVGSAGTERGVTKGPAKNFRELEQRLTVRLKSMKD
jgi:uncharacterized small protein (DUF1192 family)